MHFRPVWEENYGVAAVETGGKQMVTGHLHLDGFKSLYTPHKIKKTPSWVSFFCLKRVKRCLSIGNCEQKVSKIFRCYHVEIYPAKVK